MKTIKHSINVLIWAIVSLCLIALLLVNLPVVQSHLGSQIADVLSQKLNTRVDMGRASLGLFNRIIIDDVNIQDMKGHDMLQATRISVKADLISLLQGRISITSAQLFGMKANFYKETAQSKPNFQFALDSLASKDTLNHQPLDLELKSLIIRRGNICWNQLDKPRKQSFDTHHLNVKNLSSHIILNALRDDSINLKLKRISFTEASGLNIKSLAFKLVANRHRALLSGLNLSMPSSELHMGNVIATYRFDGNQINPATLQLNGSVRESYITPKDLRSLDPRLDKFASPVVLSSIFSGTNKSLHCHKLDVVVPQEGVALSLNSLANIKLSLSGSVHFTKYKPQWNANISYLTMNEDGLKLLGSNIPEAIGRMNSINYRGQAKGLGKNFSTQGVLRSEAGNANITAEVRDDVFTGHVDTQGLNLRQILNNDKFGKLATNIHVEGNIKRMQYRAKGNVSQIVYNQYDYRNITVDGSYNNGTFDGQISIDDPNLMANAKGKLNTNNKNMSANLTAKVRRFNPTALHLHHDKLGNATYSGNLIASFTGNCLNTATGNLYLTDFTKTTDKDEYRLNSFSLQAWNNKQGHYLTLRSDFADADLTGRFDYSTLMQSVKNAIVSRLPSIQQLTPIQFKKTQANNFNLKATVKRSDWLHQLLETPIEIIEPMRINGSLKSETDDISADVFVPNIIYNNIPYKNVSVVIKSPDNKLNADISAMKMDIDGVGMEYRVEASASNDQLASVLTVDNHARRHRLSGRLNSIIGFSKGDEGQAEAHMAIQRSNISIGDSTFTIHPSNIVYSKNRLVVNNFAITGKNQYVKVNGITTKNTNDSLMVDLNDVNVSYILNLVNFHAVEFSGSASGRGYISKVFDNPEVRGMLHINNFRFEGGRMGNLQANVNWNRELEQVDIHAQATDTMQTITATPRRRMTKIQGYVSPKRNYMDLGIEANNTRGEFVGTFCESFMDHVDLTVNGAVRLWGDLGDLNLTGELLANGKLGITPLNTTYTLRNSIIRCLINEIQFPNDTIYDRNGNVGVVSGSLYHDHLSNMSYDINVQANHLLAYDQGPSYGSTFYGTVYGTGQVDIKGKSGDLIIDANVTPEEHSQIVYDVSSPDAIGSQEFIHWSSRDSANIITPGTRLPSAHPDSIIEDDDMADSPTDIHMNFVINATPDATLKVLMDKTTGDYIALNGSGALRVAYYNKGDLDIFGNYLIDKGVYNLTIQNILKRKFNFAQGSSIIFGGDPADANINLKALYALNSVSLSDLQIGRSFSGNNIKVNCIMNISGTPNMPKVEFDLDMPTIGTDVKQMIYSLINSEEEMNQQVLYLLAVGRFYAQGTNNAGTNDADNRTSLAMQSILSGQISQQLNSVLGSVVKDTNWNLGANISPGDEGWNNAEYEGLLSGRMLNNRLLFDGQFGYRDNKNTTASFIGDFDLRYHIIPSGNLSIHVYNKTNDRYFTRNSLNTQGLGFIIKKDFDSWRSLFRWKKKK